MEVPGASQHKVGVCLYEALGTAFLSMGVNLSSGAH